jgi:hypothetical protein
MTSPFLKVIYEVTDDLPSGEPWPPDGRDLWSVVKSEFGVTTWRRLTLVQKSIPTPEVGRDH